MANTTSIEWTEATWNPVTGCTKVSAGCANCYAERLAVRLKAMGVLNYAHGFEPTMHEDSLHLPLTWKKPRSIFVNSMSDLFHEDVSNEFILKVFDVMSEAHWHRFQILTKRPERLALMSRILRWQPNIWMGVTVENSLCLDRVDMLVGSEAQVKFLSIEPMLGPLSQLSTDGIDWVIVGGESGPGARPIRYEWVAEIRDKCLKSDVPFFFKQWGGARKKETGHVLDGRTWREMPARSQGLHLSLRNG
jgi:protein gp37